MTKRKKKPKYLYTYRGEDVFEGTARHAELEIYFKKRAEDTKKYGSPLKAFRARMEESLKGLNEITKELEKIAKKTKHL